jgi:hypothetical protein
MHLERTLSSPLKISNNFLEYVECKFLKKVEKRRTYIGKNKRKKFIRARTHARTHAPVLKENCILSRM